MINDEYKIEEGMNKIMEDLNLVDDEFINNYFDDDSLVDINNVINSEDNQEPIKQYIGLEIEEKKEILNEIDDYFKLNDVKENISDDDKILKLIDNSKSGQEFFEQFEKEC